MKPFLRYFLLFIVIFSFCSANYAQDNKAEVDPYKLDWSHTDSLELEQAPTSEANNNEEYSNSPRGFINPGFVFFPFYSSTEGQSAFGLDLMYYFRRSSEAPLSEPCYFRTFFAAGRDQYVTLGTSFNNYWNNEENNLFTSLYYGRRMTGVFESSTYSPALLDVYQASDVDAVIFFRTKFKGFAYVGAKYEFIYNTKDNNFPEANGGPESGIGVFWNNTPTEEIFSPKTSFVFNIEGMLYSTWLGGNFDFGKYTFDFKEYYKVYKQHTIVFQYYTELHSGAVPYQQLASVGNIFNAYSVDKYTGRQLMAIKGEYRFPIFERTFLTAFIGTAYITDRVSKFRLNNNLPSYGGGVRFLMYSALNINARIDFVSGRDGNGVWFGIGEGF